MGVLACTILTHFINWTYQALGGDWAPAVAQMVRQAIETGKQAVQREIRRRERGEALPPELAECRTIPRSSDAQLSAGLKNYERALEGGAWEIVVRDGQLFFASEKGTWIERRGSAECEADGHDVQTGAENRVARVRPGLTRANRGLGREPRRKRCEQSEGKQRPSHEAEGLEEVRRTAKADQISARGPDRHRVSVGNDA